MRKLFLIPTGKPICLDSANEDKGEIVVRNNIELDVKVKCIENGTTQVKLAEDIDTTKSYVNRLIKRPEGVVNKTFVQMLEALGYDIEITYIKITD